MVLAFDGEEDMEKISGDFTSTFEAFNIFIKGYRTENVNSDIFNEYSAKTVTTALVKMLDAIV
jgi:hypothetical protein